MAQQMQPCPTASNPCPQWAPGNAGNASLGVRTMGTEQTGAAAAKALLQGALASLPATAGSLGYSVQQLLAVLPVAQGKFVPSTTAQVASGLGYAGTKRNNGTVVYGALRSALWALAGKGLVVGQTVGSTVGANGKAHGGTTYWARVPTPTAQAPSA